MPSFVTPWMFAVAAVAAVAVTGLHFLSVRTPPELLLPTARFVNDGTARAVARQTRLNDLLLLLLRVLALLAIGAALAGVRWHDSNARLLRLVVADSAVVRDSSWRDSVSRTLMADTVLVDVLAAPDVTADPGTALVTATARATQVLQATPSLTQVALTVVLPAQVETRAGFTAWRRAWPGPVHMVVQADSREADSTGRGGEWLVRVEGAERNDAVQAAFAMREGRAKRVMTSRGVVRVIRNASDGVAATLSATSTALPRDAQTRETQSLTVHWPRDGRAAGFVARERPDTVGAIVARGTVLVGPFVRETRLADSLQAALGTRAHAIAWWSDGEPAAVELRRVDANGAVVCQRSVSLVVPAGSDLLLSDPAQGVLGAVAAPCASATLSTAPLVSARSAAVGAAPASAFRVTPTANGGSDPWWLTPVLLAMGAILLGVESLLRNREGAA